MDTALTRTLAARIATLAVAVAVAALTGCGGAVGGAVGGARNADPCDVDKEMPVTTITASVTVPDTFNAFPPRLVLAGYSVAAQGAPDEVLAAAQQPDIGPGKPYGWPATEVPTVGELYLSVILFVQGGGVLRPVKYVDYLPASPHSVVLPSAAEVSLGEVRLSFYTGP